MTKNENQGLHLHCWLLLLQAAPVETWQDHREGCSRYRNGQALLPHHC